MADKKQKLIEGFKTEQDQLEIENVELRQVLKTTNTWLEALVEILTKNNVVSDKLATEVGNIILMAKAVLAKHEEAGQ